MNNSYTEITYQSEPIGKEKIILYLTTFDLEAFEKDKNLHKIPTKRTAMQYNFDRFEILNNQNLINDMQRQYETFIRNVYDQQLKEMQGYIEYLRNSALPYMPKAEWHDIKEINRL